PFGVAIGPDGAVFVSTLGNRDNEPSRIYRFAPGSTSDPEILFQVGNAQDAAVYGLTFDGRGRLYACVSQHLDSADPGTVVPSLLAFEPPQLSPHFNGEPLGPHDVKQNQLRAGAVNYGGFFVVDQVQAGGCGAIAYDGDAAVYVPDTSGASNYVFRFNTEGIMHQPGGQIGDAVTDEDLEALMMTAWFGDALLGGGDRFGVTGVAADGQRVAFVREGEGSLLFGLGVEGLHPAPALELAGIYAGDPVTPFGLAAVGSGRFVLSSRDADQLLLLQPAGPDYEAVVLFDRDDANEFVAPAGIAVRGEDMVVVASHFNNLGVIQDELAKAFRVQKP
ncbi:MAG TPA: hypothetical protein VFS00_08475, partial [Polyangiaceae bacterium]|nr:hypothetical protein [Polyangiaceae bacterium]